jgi:hypothetical protein
VTVPPGPFVVYIGSHGDAGAHRADVILPGAACTEKSGTWVNTEGRVQAGNRAVFPPGDAREDWAILRALSGVIGKTLPFDSLGELRTRLYADYPHIAAIDAILPAERADFDRLAAVGGAVAGAPFASPIRDFYLTSPIARASAVMAECSAMHLGPAAEAAGKGSDGYLRPQLPDPRRPHRRRGAVLLTALLIFVAPSSMPTGRSGRQCSSGAGRTSSARGACSPFADLLKFLLKEPVIPAPANKAIFLLAPLVSSVLALSAWAVIPLSAGWMIADINVGILYVFAISSLEVYGVIMGGWASNSKYAFLGALRSAAQMVSYEVSIGFVIIAVLLCVGSLNLSDIVIAQSDGLGTMLGLPGAARLALAVALTLFA